MQQDYLQMRVLEVAPQVYAAGQLFATDLDLLARQGVRSIVNTRPDGESTGQPLAADLADAAKERGIAFVHHPIESGSLTQQEAEAFARACESLERPLIVCGRSGAVSTRIWESAEPGSGSV